MHKQNGPIDRYFFHDSSLYIRFWSLKSLIGCFLLPLARHMRISQDHIKLLVPEFLLDEARIGAIFQQMRGEAMP